MLTRTQLKTASKQQLKGKWLIVGCAFFLIPLLSIGIGMIPLLGAILIALIPGPILLGQIFMVLKVVHEQEIDITDIFEGFNYLGKSIGLYILRGLFIFLWSLLLLIPGIIKGFAYSMAFYILAENPEMDILDALKESQRLTNGHKFELFMLHLSFVGWLILCSFTLGIGYFWLIPYMQVTYANAYQSLKDNT